MITPQSFLIQFPEFGRTTTPETITYWIGKAAIYVSMPGWGDLFDEGTSYWVAHQIQSSYQRQDTAAMAPDEIGAIMKKAGDTAIQYSEKLMLAKLTGDSFLSTEYGQYFLRLRRFAGAGIFAV